MVGEPEKRIKEDPLRIARIYRFKLDLGFSIDKELEKVIDDNRELLLNLRKEKILEEIRKCHHQSELRSVLENFGINNL